MGRQHQGMDRPGVRKVPEGSGEQGKLEKTCKITCGAPTNLAVKGLMIMMMMMMMIPPAADAGCSCCQGLWLGLVLSTFAWLQLLSGVRVSAVNLRLDAVAIKWQIRRVRLG